MKANKSIYLWVFCLMMIPTINYSQPYSTGIGIRLSRISSGIAINHFLNSNSSLEGIAGFDRRSFLVTGLYERHLYFPNAEGLSWYYGGGAHVGFFSDYDYYVYFYNRNHGDKILAADYKNVNSSLGGDFILGLDYKFRNAPINIGMDLKPFVDVIPGFYGYWEGAFTFRFTL